MSLVPRTPRSAVHYGGGKRRRTDFGKVGNDILHNLGDLGKMAADREEKLEAGQAEDAEAVKNATGSDQGSNVNKSSGRTIVSDTKTVIDTIHFNITGPEGTTSTGADYRDIEVCSHTPFPTSGNRIVTTANTFGEVSAWSAVPGFPNVFGVKYPTYDHAKSQYFNSLVLECLVDMTITYKKSPLGSSDSDYMAVWIDVFNPKSRSYNGPEFGAGGRVGFRDIEEMFEQGRCVKLLTERSAIASHTDAQNHAKYANGKSIVKADADGRARFNLRIQPWRYTMDGPEGAVNATSASTEEKMTMYNYENTCCFDSTGSKHGHAQSWYGTAKYSPLLRIYWQPWRETDDSTTKIDDGDISIIGSIKTKWHYYNPQYIAEEHPAV